MVQRVALLTDMTGLDGILLAALLLNQGCDIRGSFRMSYRSRLSESD
jgi:GDP-D-mannose dehydratase